MEGFARLLTKEGQAALAAAAAAPADPLLATSHLRRAGFDHDLAAAALTQVALRRRAVAKFGPAADRMYFTRPGLEQATRAVVAERRAGRVAATGLRRLADLGCGIGADALAFARAGFTVRAVDADSSTVDVVRANAAALGLADRVVADCAEAESVDLSDVDVVFCDPARRAGVRRVFDPAAYSPSWSFVAGLPDRVPHTVLKLAPGIDHALLPAGAEAEWVSVDGDLVEAAVWCGPLATVRRRATVLRGGESHELTGTGQQAAEVAAVDRFLFEPDGAVVRAHLVAEFASTVDGSLADPRVAYVFAARPALTPFGRCFEVREQLPYAVKRLRAALRERGVGRLEILKRAVAVEPERLRRALRLSGDAGATLVLLRIGTEPTALLCEPVGSVAAYG